MNFLKMKKAIANTEFQNVNQYISHMDAYNKVSKRQTEEERFR